MHVPSLKLIEQKHHQKKCGKPERTDGQTDERAQWSYVTWYCVTVNCVTSHISTENEKVTQNVNVCKIIVLLLVLCDCPTSVTVQFVVWLISTRGNETHYSLEKNILK